MGARGRVKVSQKGEGKSRGNQFFIANLAMVLETGAIYTGEEWLG
jgi:hypothetical protein